MPRAIIADARKVSPRAFLDALGLSSPELRAERQRNLEEQCIRAIERGDTYGWPPMMVADCRRIMAEREPILGLTAEELSDPFLKSRRAA